jgi:hypothetical protein
MKHSFSFTPLVLLGIVFHLMSISHAQDAPTAEEKSSVAGLDQALIAAKEGSSDARKRLAVRRVIRDAETLLGTLGDKQERYPVLEFVFRARKQLIVLDDDPDHRKALLDVCRELVKAPDEMAAMRVEADLLLSQAELAKQGGDAAARANSLMPFVARYIDTTEGARVLRMAMVMALELGDSRVVTDLQEIMEERFAADLEMIEFQRSKLGGQVFGAPFSGAFERSDGKIVRFPMEGFGRLTLCVFWSNDEEGKQLLKGLAAGAVAEKDLIKGRLEIVSFNLDDLPDAGESVIRGLGVEWQALRLPGGKENPIFKAYARTSPRMLSVSPTGYSAMIMSGTTRQKYDPAGEVDYGKMLGSSLAREWTNLRYAMQLVSLSAGDFLVLDPEGAINSALPPELKATAKDGLATPLAAGATSVPDEILRAIQESFVVPPQRYRQTYSESLASYTKTVELCRKAIADHPSSANLWIVRNRLIVALMGIWKTKSDLNSLEAAVTEAKAALTAGYPKGCEVIARFCIARGSLLDLAADPKKIIEAFVSDCGGESAPGPVFAAASLLALDAADRGSFGSYRKTILEKHTEHPMMWSYTAFLLDRHHDYWLFQVPFNAGWSYGRRYNYFMSVGAPQKGRRILRTELGTLDGKTMKIPEDLDSDWTIIVFVQPGPWSRQRDDGLPPSPLQVMSGMNTFMNSRPAGDVKVMLATLGGEPDAIRVNLEELIDPNRKQPGVESPVLIVPGGINNPVVYRLGMLSEDQKINSVLLRKDGSIALAMSGFIGSHNSNYVVTHANVIQRADEEFVNEALKRGEVETAKARILSLAPVFDPNEVDEKGRKLKAPVYSLAHLRARARVYMALKEWEKALADAQEVVQRQLSTDGGMSLRTDELDESEKLRDSIQEQIQGKK